MTATDENGASETPMKKPRGFAAMTPEKRRQIASMGGKAVHEYGNAYEWDSALAAEAGRRGGAAVSQDREHMSKIGRRGGEAKFRLYGGELEDRDATTTGGTG